MSYFKILLSLFGVYLLYLMIRERIKRGKYKKVFKEVFENSKSVIPKLKLKGNYGYPVFEVDLNNKDQVEELKKNGMLDSFKEKIQAMVEKEISDFDVEISVYFTINGEFYSH